MLRAEKGYIIVGQETDGTVTPADLGLDWAIGKAKARFRRQALARAARHSQGDGRKQLVGLLTDDPALVLEEGAQVTESARPRRRLARARPRHLVLSQPGRSAARSRWRSSPAAAPASAQRVHVSTPAGRAAPATVAQACAYDPEGARLHV